MDLKKKSAFLVGVAIILFMLFIYNNVRISGIYRWGFVGKEYSINFIPLKNIFRTVEFFNIKILEKIVFFSIIGIIQSISISQLTKIKIKYFTLFSLCTVFLTELLMSISSESIVVIDANNFIFYMIGFAIGYLLFRLIQWGYDLLNFKIKLIKVPASDTKKNQIFYFRWDD